jgi:hypothetical protein
MDGIKIALLATALAKAGLVGCARALICMEIARSRLLSVAVAWSDAKLAMTDFARVVPARLSAFGCPSLGRFRAKVT